MDIRPKSKVIKSQLGSFGFDGRQLKAIEDERFRHIYGSVMGDSLTRNPKGFPQDHPYGYLLRLKDVIFSRPISDREVHSAELPDIIAKDLEAARPVLLFLDKLAGPAQHDD